MTDHHDCTGSVRPAFGLPTGSERRGEVRAPVGTGADLFAGYEPAPAGPHPDFEAKAAIWRDHRAGLISLCEAQRRSAAIGAASSRLQVLTGARGEGREGQGAGPSAGRGKARPPVARPRHQRPAPAESRQYANPLATTAARDDRVTPQAKALLTVLRARAGKGTVTRATKSALAGALARSTRSICRYLRDLERWGYIATRTRTDHRGYHLGLVITILEKALPFYTVTAKLARWLGETSSTAGRGGPLAPFRPFETPSSPMIRRNAMDWKGMTVLSSKNQTNKDSSPNQKNGREEKRWGRARAPS